jgi:hypothetical protein
MSVCGTKLTLFGCEEKRSEERKKEKERKKERKRKKEKEREEEERRKRDKGHQLQPKARGQEFGEGGCYYVVGVDTALDTPGGGNTGALEQGVKEAGFAGSRGPHDGSDRLRLDLPGEIGKNDLSARQG